MSFKWRLTALMLLCLAMAGGVIARAAYLQILRDERVETLARRQFQSRVLIRPRRGAIVDRNGEALAVNAEIQSLAANPAKITNKGTLARLLARSLDLPPAKVLERLRGKREFTWIKRHLTDAELARLKKFGVIGIGGDDDELMAGLWLVKESQRVYPHNELAAHVLGDVNLDSEGLEGIELAANARLEGKVVSVTAVKDALGRPTFIDANAARQVRDGETVALTIDASLQYSAEQELRAAVQKHGARSGTVIVMNAVNGEILALANEPAFNPNLKGANPAARRNRAITDGYEPGSTLKAVLLASALGGGMRLTDRLHGERGSFVVQGHRISEAETHEKFGWTSLKDMIKLSSNVVAAKLALRVGNDRYQSTLRAFGFGSRTDVGFPGEIRGQLPPGRWQPLTLANVGFGQGLLVTPIQMTRAYAAFLNGGWLVQPTLLKSQVRPEAPRRILPQKVADQVIEALRSVTEDRGTGMSARLEGYTVAGKTGTAQAVDPVTRRYSRSRYIASFIGFAVGVDPKLVIFTSIDEPHGSYYASETAAPLFRAVLNAAATRFSLPARGEASRALAMATQPAKGAAKARRADGLSDRLSISLAKVIPGAAMTDAEPEPQAPNWVGTTPAGDKLWTMPQLRGLTAREAIRLLAGRRFRLEVHGTGVIRAQSLEPGRPAAEGATLRLTLAEP